MTSDSASRKIDEGQQDNLKKIIEDYDTYAQTLEQHHKDRHENPEDLVKFWLAKDMLVFFVIVLF